MILKNAFYKIRIINNTSVEYKYERAEDKIYQKYDLKYFFNMHYSLFIPIIDIFDLVSYFFFKSIFIVQCSLI